MTSSSRAELLGLLLLAAAGGCATIAPDAPRPAVAQEERRPLAVEPSHLRPVALASVRAYRPDEKLARFAGPNFLRDARDPIAIEVKTEQPLPTEIRDASPAIVLNGELLADTWVFRPNTLVAFLPDRARLRDVNSVEVVWIGAEQQTRSPRPLTFRRDEVR